MAKTTTYAKKRKTLTERVKLLVGGLLFGGFAVACFTNIPGSEGFIGGVVCSGLSAVGFFCGLRGYDELKKR